MSRDLAKSRNQRLMEIYGQNLVKVNYHPAKFGGETHSGSGDITF